MDKDSCSSRIVHIEKVDAARRGDLQSEDVDAAIHIFKILSDPGRLRMLNALMTQEMCVCDLAAFLEASESSVSHQLRILRQADLVANRRDGTVLYYRILNRGLEKVIDSAILLEQEKDKQQEEI
jgi:DNA-binding transcriptional ArsR family regulator